MQAPGANVRTVLQWPLVVTTMSCQSRLKRQFVAVVRPPAVHTHRKGLAMPRPVVADVQRRIEIFWRPPHPGPLPLGGREGGQRDNGRAKKISRRVVDMKNNFEIHVVERFDVFRHERIRVERQRTMASVPTIRTIAGAEIYQ